MKGNPHTVFAVIVFVVSATAAAWYWGSMVVRRPPPPPASETVDVDVSDEPPLDLDQPQDGLSVRIEEPDVPGANLMWSVLQCSRGPNELCTLGVNTAWSIESAGHDLKLCALWSVGDVDKLHCVDVTAQPAEVSQ